MGAVYALICLVVMVSSFALAQSLKEKEEDVSGVDNGEPLRESHLPIVVGPEQNRQLDLEVLVQLDIQETGSGEMDGQKEAGGETNIEGIEDNPGVKDPKLSAGRESTVLSPEQEESPEVAEEQKSFSEAVQNDSPKSELRNSDVGEGETGEVQRPKEREGQGEEVGDDESQDQEGGREGANDLVSSEERATEGGVVEDGVLVSQGEHQLQVEEEEEGGKREEVKGEEGEGEKEGEKEKESEKKEEEEGEKEEEEGDLTFEEFKRRKMMEQEATQQVEESVASIRISKTKDNYASVDCGAKVIATNKQAQNPTAILIENKDVYMLNPCSANIWFIVELCDMVSVQMLEIACLELFSSVPESFNVYSAESYPDPEWVHLGKFHAANKREVQSFPLATDRYVYAKYIKVEMLSHYGHEHYCPLSLLRVLGASMIQVFQYSEEQKEQKAGQQQQTVIPASGVEEESLGEVKDEKLRKDGTLLNAAKDAVLSLLEQPLNLLGVNGFRKPEGEGDPVTEDEDMSQRASKNEEGMNSNDQGVPKQNMEEEREKSLSEEDHSLPASSPEVKANVSDSENISTEQPSTPLEEPQGDPNTQTTDSNLYLGPRDPHLLSEEYSINSETEEKASNKSSPQDRDLVDRYKGNDTTIQEGDFVVGKSKGESPSGGSDSVQQFQNDVEESGEGSTVNGGHSDLKTQQQTTEGVSTPELSLVEEARVLEDGDETGAGDGEEGLGLDVGLRNKAAEKEDGGDKDDETGCKETAKERMKVLRETTQVLNGDKEEEMLSQNNQPLGPTSSEMGEEGVVMGTEPSDPQDTLMAGGVQNGATATVPASTNGRLSREILEEDNVVEKRASTGGIDKHNSTNVPLLNASQAENAGSNDSNRTEDQLSVAKLDDNGDRLEANASLNDTTDGITFNDSLHSQSVGSEPVNVSLTTHNASCGGTNGVPQPREKSVFVRLSNRIRDLEVNMSLFSSYLDQLSSSLKRNKNKTEDTQKSLDKRISALNESLQLLRQETEIGLAGLRRVSTDLHQVAAAVQEMATGLHSTREEITSQFLLVSVIQVSAVTFALLAVCLWLTCKQQALRNELRALQITVTRIPTQDYVNHVEKNHTHERCGYIPKLQSPNHIQPSNHIRPSNHIWRSDCLWNTNSHSSCDERGRELSSLDDGDWESEPWHLVARGHKKKAKLNKSHSS